MPHLKIVWAPVLRAASVPPYLRYKYAVAETMLSQNRLSGYSQERLTSLGDRSFSVESLVNFSNR